MRIVERPGGMRDLSASWRAEGLTVGLVPTMGALHEGHLSLVRAARASCDRVVASVFVNPTQFGAGEDFDTYARPFERDGELLREMGCDALFAPDVETMYGGPRPDLSPSGNSVFVDPGRLGGILEGEARPGHMRGVATVVAMLFNATTPDRAFFGEKDYQQLKLIQKMARDLHFGVEVVPCPTVREPDGLALSSRNANLSTEEREAALALSRALNAARDLRSSGEREVRRMVEAMEQVCAKEPLVSLRYAAIADAETLEPLQILDVRPARALISADVGVTHLIDNLPL